VVLRGGGDERGGVGGVVFVVIRGGGGWVGSGLGGRSKVVSYFLGEGRGGVFGVGGGKEQIGKVGGLYEV